MGRFHAILASPYFSTARGPHKIDIHRISYVCIDLPLLLIYKRLLKELRRREKFVSIIYGKWLTNVENGIKIEAEAFTVQLYSIMFGEEKLYSIR